MSYNVVKKIDLLRIKVFKSPSKGVQGLLDKSLLRLIVLGTHGTKIYLTRNWFRVHMYEQNIKKITFVD